MSNKIQIKRSVANGTVSGLANGELAFTQASNTLWIGLPDGSGVVSIAGQRTPGTLTANQALVANSTSGIDKVITANLVVNQIYANGSHGSNGFLLASNSAGNTYWLDPSTLATSAGGSNTQVQFNDSGVFGATAGFTFNKTTNNLSVANSLIIGSTGNNQIVNLTNTSLEVRGGWADNNGSLNLIGGNYGTSTYAKIGLQGNTKTVALEANTTLVKTLSGAEIAIGNSSGWFVNGQVNASSLTVGSSFVANASGVSGNGAGLTSVDAAKLNGITAAELTVNAATYALNANNAAYLGSNTVSDLNTYASDKAANAYANAMADTLTRDGTYTGNNIFSGANTGISGFLTTANADLASIRLRGTQFQGGSYERNVIDVNASDWLRLDGGNYGVELRAANDGASWFTLKLDGNTGALVPGANGTMDLGTSGQRFGKIYLAGQTIELGNSTISDTANGVTISNLESTNNALFANIAINGVIASDLMPSSNVTYNVGNNTVRWNEIHASNVHSVTGYFDGSVEIAGNLIVSGNVTTTNVSSVIVSDPMIYLAGNNYTSDLLDIGFSGNYYDGATVRHTGFIRHASTDQYYLFKNLTQELDNVNVVDINDSSFRLADLNAWLLSGGLVSNSSAVSITANSTVSVSITANTLSLSTPLGSTSGGTGYSSYTQEDILVANSSNGFRKLAANSGVEGYVLQVSAGVVAWSTLDGGIF